jgi:hypothetical protein
MVAIVILGLGLVMVATIFPIAWGRARQLSEVTTQKSITEGAKTALGLLTRVDGLDYNAASFVGDLVYCKEDQSIPNSIVMYSDTRVHFLHMENLLVSPRAFAPSRTDPWLGASYSPWMLERTPLLGAFDPASTVCAWPAQVFDCRDTFLSPQVRFGQRVHPPMRPRNADTLDLEGLFIEEDEQWDEMLNTRRYAWAVFHRLPELCTAELPGIGVGPLENAVYLNSGDAERLAEAAIESCRHDFEVYYVMLRRPQSTLRYARQDPATAPDPYNLQSTVEFIPAALPATDDFALPEPWRVQIWIPSARLAADATGIPTEIEVPPPDFDESPDPLMLIMLAQMFQRGTPFIDEVNGEIYEVIKYRLASDGQKAYLTLDREITVEELNLPGSAPEVLEPEEQLRTVWVFPPPVQATRMGENIPVFEGPHPVVEIEKAPDLLHHRPG